MKYLLDTIPQEEELRQNPDQISCCVLKKCCKKYKKSGKKKCKSCPNR